MKIDIRTLMAGVSLTCAFMTVRAGAQDANLEPSYGAVELKAGFKPNPFTIDLQPGGLSKTAKGGVPAFVAEKPDFVLDYTAGDFVLTIYAESDVDTTLLIQQPDGEWVANDDGPGTGQNPLIRFEKPQKSGLYKIWVGTFKKESGRPKAKLTIVESEPANGSVTLKAGFDVEPDAAPPERGRWPTLSKDLETVRTEIAIPLVVKKPDFVLEYKADKYPLTIYAESKADTILLVLPPDGKFVTNRDWPGSGLTFPKPQSGRYTIWVGSLGRESASAKLMITEMEPTFGSVKKKADFRPDPLTKEVKAGGRIKTDKGRVNAFVAKNPDFVFEYQAGKFPLTIYAESKADTILLVRPPDGKFMANGDWPGSGLRFEKPQSGRYTIWVGTLGKEFAEATLTISEIRARYGLVKLKAGFEPGPLTIELEAGGTIKTKKGGVNAFVDKTPDFVLEYEADKADKHPLTIYAESKADTTLLVQLPDGNWQANDNGPGTGLNPVVRIENPQSGRYTIWVGTVKANLAKAKLMITEMDAPKEWSWQTRFPFDPFDPKITYKDVKSVIERLPPCNEKKDNVRGTPYEEYKLQFKKDRFYEIEMRADARMFFPCLRLEDSAGRQVKSASSRDKADDGSADVNTTARMTYFCKEAGAFTLIATNYSGAFGTFDIKVREETPYIYMKDKDEVFEGFSGELIRSDSKDSVLRKSLCKTFWFRFEKGSTYDIELAARFDMVLRLEDDAGQELAFNDDRPAGPDAAGIRYAHKGTDSRITFACRSDRTYRIIATSLDPYYQSSATGPVGYGKFDLTVAKVIRDTEFTAAHVEKFITDVMKTTFKPENVSGNATVNYLTPHFNVTYDSARETVVFNYTREALPGKAAEWNLQKGRMFKAEEDHDNKRIVRLSGTISFADGNFADGISFAKLKELYDWLSREESEFGVWLLPISDVILADGKVKQGQLTSEDRKDPFHPVSPAKVYAVTLTGGKTYQIDMNSTEVDSYLGIHDAAGRSLASDDNSGGDLNAKIIFNCPADGTYRIVATTAKGDQFGKYTLTVSQK